MVLCNLKSNFSTIDFVKTFVYSRVRFYPKLKGIGKLLIKSLDFINRILKARVNFKKWNSFSFILNLKFILPHIC